MAKTFRDLGVDPALCDALADNGITHPFPIQELTLPLALDGNDLIGQARTGTGKTLAFGLPLLQRVDPTLAHTQALVIVPTRELCLQVYADLQIGAARGLTSISVYGGVGYEEQTAALDAGAHIVVGTPGRLLDLFQRGVLNLSRVTQLVLDEADEMLDMGFLPDVERLVEASTGARRHTMLFSATMPTVIVKLARRYMDRPTFIRADHEERHTAPLVTQYFFQVHRMDKPRLLARILQDRDRGGVYVFVRTKHMADRLVNDLEELRVPAIAIHGDLRQTTREKNLDRFRSGKATVLVCTEVAARGLDVSGVTHVVNYDCPEDEKMYLHRIGRTARAGEAGAAITFAEFNEIDRLNVIRKAVGATESEVEQIFSTSKQLQEYFDLPEERPWDHLSRGGDERSGTRSAKSGDRRGDGERGRGSRGRDTRGQGDTRTRDDRNTRGDRNDRKARDDRREHGDNRKRSDDRRGDAQGRGDSPRDGGKDDTRANTGKDDARVDGGGDGRGRGRGGRSDGRPKNPRSSEGRGGDHDARRRVRARPGDERPADKRPADQRPDTERPDQRPAPAAAETGSSEEATTRTRTRTRARTGGRTPAEDRDRESGRDTSASSDDRATRPERDTPVKAERETAEQAPHDATGQADDTTAQPERDAPAQAEQDTAAPPRARQRARGRRGQAKRSATTGTGSTKDGGDDRSTTSPADDRAAEDADRATPTATSGRTSGEQRRDSDPAPPKNGRSRADRGTRGGECGGNAGRASRGRDRGRATRTERRSEHSGRQPVTAAKSAVQVVDRGEDARGDGQPRSARRVTVEHLP